MPGWRYRNSIPRLIMRLAAYSLVICCLADLRQDASAGPAIHVIANNTQDSNSLSIKELRAIFTMRLHEWPNHQPIKVFVLQQDNPVHIQFCKDILNAYPHQLQAGWDRLVYSGTGKAPDVVDSEQQMLELIARTPGAIGYTQEVKADGNIKIINVQ